MDQTEVIVALLLVVGSSVGVYLDAVRNEIGETKDAGGFFNMSAGGWFAATLLLWIVGLPIY